MSPATSSRWSPTREQLMILEELYRSVIRTPNVSQIQHITVHLSYFGKIQGKNVFIGFRTIKQEKDRSLEGSSASNANSNTNCIIIIITSHTVANFFNLFNNYPASVQLDSFPGQNHISVMHICMLIYKISNCLQHLGIC